MVAAGSGNAEGWQRAYLFGFPVNHSISPAIHNAAFEDAGLPVHYSARAITPDDLPSAVGELRAPFIVGANITVPHKEAVMKLVDDVDTTASRVGAANTIANRNGRLWATNTDGVGFARSLAEAGLVIEGAFVVLLGAGGSARAVSSTLLALGAGHLLIANRSPERAAQLAAELGCTHPGAAVGTVPLSDLRREMMARRALIVNATSVGLHGDETPISAAQLPREGAVVDIIYNPPRTRLLRDAAAAGLTTLNGLGMLVHQAAVAWEAWTGQPAPLEVMWSVASASLEPSAAQPPASL